MAKQATKQTPLKQTKLAKTKASLMPVTPQQLLESTAVVLEAVAANSALLDDVSKRLDRALYIPAHAPVGSYFATPPTEVRVPLAPPHVDDRGHIHNITHLPVGSTAIIFSKANTTRARHWHREDAHLCYVVSGIIQYFERPVGSEAPPKRYLLRAGDAFYTGPRVEHEMFFPADTVFLTLGNRSRTQEDYEKDLVRLPASLRDAYIAATGEA